MTIMITIIKNSNNDNDYYNNSNNDYNNNNNDSDDNNNIVLLQAKQVNIQETQGSLMRFIAAPILENISEHSFTKVKGSRYFSQCVIYQIVYYTL